MALYSKKTVLLAKIETTSGTDSVPTGADNAVQAYEVDLKIKSDMKERYPGNSDRSAYPEVRGLTTCEIKFNVELRGSGSVGTAPKYGPLMRACDKLETLAANSAVYYDPASTSETCTIYVNFDGIYHKILGCAGDCELDLNSGELGMLKFSIQGIYALPIDTAVPTPTFDTTTPPIVKGSVTTLGLYAAIVEKINLKFGNKIVQRTDMNQSEGVKAFMVTDRNPSGTLTCELVLKATASADWWNYFDAGITKALSTVIGSTAGNIITVQAPACRLRAPEYGDRDGLRIVDLPFQMARNGTTANSEYRIALT